MERDEPNEVARLENELHVPPLPPAMTFLWLDYNRLRGRKAYGFNGPNPIEWHDVEAFTRLTGRRFTPWMVELIEDIDQAYLTAAYKKEGAGASSAPSKGPIAPEIFDAMFG
ncbi:MAG: hypothetical protein H6877_10140 [Rhodobiaceae bacterium]|nr:hypothetical protein [Rhodobiaceae bacterium]